MGSGATRDVAATAGSSNKLPNAHEAQPVKVFELGDPIEGLTPDELAAFERGKLVFERRFTPSTGLGPFYNATSCQSCHNVPVTGGSAPMYRNFFLARWGTPQTQGGLPPFVSPVIPAFGSGGDHATTFNFTLEGGRTCIPDTFNGFPTIVAQRNALPIFGVGMFEFVSNATILSHADPFDNDGDGVSGRHNIDITAVGRFGVKSQANSIEGFTRAPFMNQLGVTSNPFLGSDGIISLCRLQVSTDPNLPLIDHDPAPDPEISHQDLGDVIAFTRFLAPPRPKPFTPEATHGQLLFDQIGCTKCHIPSLPSSRGPVNAYTDLLIHYMGDALADQLRFGANGVTSFEFRTQPLWGVSMHAPFLHDGRAETLHDAIWWHGGEAQAMRDAYLALSSSDQSDVVAFLEHL